MKTLHSVWWLLMTAIACGADDWMLHTPGGGPLESRCPCMAPELCPRIFGASELDARHFGQIPICMDSRQVRCCGASTGEPRPDVRNLRRIIEMEYDTKGSSYPVIVYPTEVSGQLNLPVHNVVVLVYPLNETDPRDLNVMPLDSLGESVSQTPTTEDAATKSPNLMPEDDNLLTSESEVKTIQERSAVDDPTDEVYSDEDDNAEVVDEGAVDQADVVEAEDSEYREEVSVPDHKTLHSNRPSVSKRSFISEDLKKRIAGLEASSLGARFNTMFARSREVAARLTEKSLIRKNTDSSAAQAPHGFLPSKMTSTTQNLTSKNTPTQSTETSSYGRTRLQRPRNRSLRGSQNKTISQTRENRQAIQIQDRDHDHQRQVTTNIELHRELADDHENLEAAGKDWSHTSESTENDEIREVEGGHPFVFRRKTTESPDSTETGESSFGKRTRRRDKSHSFQSSLINSQDESHTLQVNHFLENNKDIKITTTSKIGHHMPQRTVMPTNTFLSSVSNDGSNVLNVIGPIPKGFASSTTHHGNHPDPLFYLPYAVQPQLFREDVPSFITPQSHVQDFVSDSVIPEFNKQHTLTPHHNMPSTPQTPQESKRTGVEVEQTSHSNRFNIQSLFTPPSSNFAPDVRRGTKTASHLNKQFHNDAVTLQNNSPQSMQKFLSLPHQQLKHPSILSSLQEQDVTQHIALSQYTKQLQNYFQQLNSRRLHNSNN